MARISILFFAYIAFVSLGLPDALHGIAWPDIRTHFGLHQSALGMILATGCVGYLLSSFFTGKLLRLMHVGTLLFFSTMLVAIGLLGYAFVDSWTVFLACAFFIGTGSGAIDGGLNSFASKNFSARHMTWLHGCYGVGASIGPLIMTQAILAKSWHTGYLAVALAMVAMTCLFGVSRSAWNASDRPISVSETKVSLMEALRSRNVWLQILTFFLYTGLEAMVAQWSFTLNTESRMIPVPLAGFLTSLFWMSLTFGRFLMGVVVAKVGQLRLLLFSFSGVVLGAALFTVPSTPVTAISMGLLGISLSAIYPLLMMETSHRVGQALSDHSVGLQVSAATLGAVALPSLAGFLSQKLNLGVIPYLSVTIAITLFMLNLMVLRMAKIIRR